MTVAAGTKLGRYEIRSQLGAGGMGEVYLAKDTKLDRKVALKILPVEVASNQLRMGRFEQEAKAASALNHPNILTIYEIDQTDSVHFIATEYVEGETLRQHMRDAPMKLGEVLDIATQIASGLSAAHAAGIVHRDVKPENVMLRRDGLVKVLDFGLAKVTEPLTQEPVDPEAPTRGAVNTQPGVVMGTAIYMSPEQARGRTLDGRTDTFSLGVVLYEMVAGCLPFQGPTANDVIASILNEKEPPPIARFARDVPSELEHIVSKALRKDREERYQTVKDMLIDLKDLRRDLELQAQLEHTIPPESSATSNRNRQTLTTAASAGVVETDAAAAVRSTSSAEYIVAEIKRHKRGAVIMLALLLGITAVLSYLFYFKPKPASALTEKDTILLADFDNTTGDAVFDGTLKQALAVQLSQTPFLNIFGDERIREALRFMGRSSDERLMREVALEICKRQGIKALLAGSISSLGSHYVITLEAIDAQSGDAMTREQVEAESKEEVLKKLGEAATTLREQLGESLASIQKFDAPIEQATTSSLEAFKAYTLGREQHLKGKYLEAIPLYKRATDLDPNFALAYARLAYLYVNSRQFGLAAEASQKAYDLRDRVSERERLVIASNYYDDVTREVEKKIETLELWKRTYPFDFQPHNNLAFQYINLGEYEKAVEEARQAIALNPNAAPAHSNLASALVGLNRFDEAKEVIERALAQKMDSWQMHRNLYFIAFVRGDVAAMKQQIEWANGKPDEYAAQRWQAETAALSGQLRKAKEFSDRAVELALRSGLKDVAAELTVFSTTRDVSFGDCKQVKEQTAKALAITQSYSTRFFAAYALAACGEFSGTQAITDEMLKRYPKDTLLNDVVLPLIQAYIEMFRGNAAQAIQLLERTRPHEGYAGFQISYLRGQSYLTQQKGAEAAVEFQKILDHWGARPGSPLYPLAQLGLARAAVLQGDTAKARKAYEDFFAFWKDADADLPILVEARKEYQKLK
jgi:serine/threonine protein kinase/Tfp pilus assembly protein PilF